MAATTANAAEAQLGRRVEFRTILLTIAVTFLNSFGNLSMAWGMRHFPQSVGINPFVYIHALFNPFVALGVAMLILWLLTRMALMSWADLSFVLPMSAFGYVLAAILGKFFLNETVTPRHWLGTLLIFGGTAIVGSTAQKTDSKGETRQ